MAAGSVRYTGFRFVIRILIKLYYRSIEIYGRSFIPRDGRTLIIANHQTGLVDGLLIIGTNNLVIRTIIKHTLWENPVIGFFASGLGMIPVYRKQDLKPTETVNAGRNQGMFDAVEKIFLGKESALIFPEGVSHDNPHILKLRSGAARMLLQTEASKDFRLGLKWLPVSLDNETKDHQGARVLIHYHPPRAIASYRAKYEKDPEAAVEELRNEMEEYLSEITINFETWEDRAFIERLTEIWLAQAPMGLLLDRHNQLLKWKRIFESAKDDPTSEWNLLRAKVNELQEMLEGSTLKPREIFRHSPEARHKAVARVLPRLFFWAPIILLGRLLWWPATKLIMLIARGAESRDVISTYHITSAIVLYPLWFVIVAPLLYYFLPVVAATGVLIIFVASGVSHLIVARRLKIEWVGLWNLYRYGSLEKLFEEAEQKLLDILRLAARMWNQGLNKQVNIFLLSKEANLSEGQEQNDP